MRLTLAAVAWLALAGAVVFLVKSEKQLTDRREAARTFSEHAREAAETLADLRVGQQAYVAAGQGVAFWMPKVTSASDAAAQSIGSLRETASSAEARTALDAAAQALTDFSAVDKRAREYLKADQQLMAADVVFTEGGPAAAAAARQVEAAGTAEQLGLDGAEASTRQIEAAVAAGAAGLSGLVLLLLVGKPKAKEEASMLGIERSTQGSAASRAVDVPARDARAISPVLRTAAALCTDFGRVRDVGDLNQLLARAADVMDASGLVVWIGSGSAAAGDDRLRPVLAHGYAPKVLAKMPPVARSANNAAAAAYRTGSLQIVLTQPGTSSGAIVAPLLSVDGCIGALSVEVRGGGEGSDSVQALAAIFAAQLAPIAAASLASVERAPEAARVANQ